LRTTLTRTAQGILDESIRVRWLKGPVGRELVELAGPMDAPRAVPVAGASAKHAAADLDDADRQLLRLLTEGRTNGEIATELQLDEEDVVQRLARLQAQLGASSRSEATSLAFRGLAAVGSR
jgi:DNA-binding NarL/FixJ family response regulator